MSQQQPEPLIIATPELMPLPEGENFYLHDHMFPLDKKGREFPNFTNGEVAKFFFGRSFQWIQWRIEENYFVLDGVPVGTKRDPKTNFHYYSLADIERMAHALAGVANGIDGRQLRRTVLIVKTVAEMYGYL